VQKKIFSVEVLLFSLCFEGLFGFLNGISGSVSAFFAWCSMLFCVKFDVGMRGVWGMLRWALWL